MLWMRDAQQGLCVMIMPTRMKSVEVLNGVCHHLAATTEPR